MSNTFCVTITHCKTDPDKATLGFVVANAAQGSEKETMVFLSSDGVWCAVADEMDGQIDAVMVSTTDHTHAPAAIRAIRATPSLRASG